jgi:hypothetical protein
MDSPHPDPMTSASATLSNARQQQPADSNEEPTDKGGGKEGLSAFAARVLDQLSVTAWLPAALLTASIAVLFRFRQVETLDLPAAIVALTDDPFQLLVVLGPLLVIATMVTQAFSFSAIRTLEGYWHRRGLVRILRNFMMRRQYRRWESLQRRLKAANRKAFDVARVEMLEAGISPMVVLAMESKFHRKPLPALTPAEQDEFRETRWKDFCSPSLRASVESLTEEVSNYPERSRILPTLLGNRLRAVEDQLENAGDDLEGFVMRVRPAAPARLLLQHDQFRERLDMYCTMVFVAIVLAALTPAILGPSRIDWLQIAILSASFLALAVTSYFAAVSSAGGYVTVLRAMDKLETSKQNAANP